MLLLKGRHTRKAALHAQSLNVAGIDACNHRIEQGVYRLLPETPATELRDGLIRRCAGPGSKGLEQHPETPPQRQHPRKQEGAQAAGERLELTLSHQVAVGRARRGRQQVLIEPETGDQLKGVRSVVEHAVGALFKKKTIDPFRANRAAASARSLDDLHRRGGSSPWLSGTQMPQEEMRGGQSGNATTDYKRVK